MSGRARSPFLSEGVGFASYRDHLTVSGENAADAALKNVDDRPKRALPTDSQAAQLKHVSIKRQSPHWLNRAPSKMRVIVALVFCSRD